MPSQPQESLENAWLQRLPAPKAAAIGRLRMPEDRNASLLGIALLAAACADLGLAFDPRTLDYPRHGKPRLPGGPDFSISHTRGLVACAAAATGRIGLDVEPAGSVTAAVAARVLAAAEHARIATGEFTATDAWVMKEAVVKLAGRGLETLRAVALEAGRARLEGAEYWLQPVRVAGGFVAWLASDAAARSLATHAAGAAAPAPLPGRR